MDSYLRATVSALEKYKYALAKLEGEWYEYGYMWEAKWDKKTVEIIEHVIYKSKYDAWR